MIAKVQHPGRRKLLVCLAAPVLGLLVAEGLARAAGLRPPMSPQVEGNLFVDVQNPVLLFVNAPNAEMIVTHQDYGSGGERRVVMRTNAQRFRGPLVDPTKPPGVLRVACLGDSHTWGEGVADNETWPAQLAALCPPGVEVLNCGVNSYDTAQELLWFARWVESFDPDVVLLAYFPNDVAARGVPAKAGAPDYDRWVTWTHPRQQGWLADMRRHSVAVDALCDRIYRLRSFSARLASWEARYVEGDEGWERVKISLDWLAARCERDGREFRVLLFPYLVREGEVFASNETLARVAAHCARSNIACFDGESALLAELDGQDASALRVSPADFHANGRAYSAFARAVAAWLPGTGVALSAP